MRSIAVSGSNHHLWESDRAGDGCNTVGLVDRPERLFRLEFPLDANKSDPSLETLLNAIDADELDLQPNFQRGEVWDGKRRQRLVDTVLRDWYVPAVHIVVDERDGREAVLDGQQRLAALRDFVANLFPIDGSIQPDDSDVRALDGLYFRDLSPARQRAFRTFVIPVIRLTHFKPQEPNELFFRLNQSYNLTPPEKRNALHGPARDQVKDLVNDLDRSGFLRKEVVGFNNHRLAYDDIIARTCVAVEMDTLRRHINNDTVERYYRDEAFSSETLFGVRQSSERLAHQIDVAGAHAKFNKGTLQTWLLYCYWAPQVVGEVPDELFVAFETQRLAARRGEGDQSIREAPIVGVVRMYDDRASYRVTDVSSVLIRDVAIHLFSEETFGTPSVRGSGALLSDLHSSPSLSTQALLDEYLAQSNWGEPLVPSGRVG